MKSKVKRWKILNLEVIERDGWIKVRGNVWIEGKGGKGFEKPLMYIGKEGK
jgi:hypothetical protein